MPDRTIKATLLLTSALGLFYMILGFLPGNQWWGFNHLLFLPLYLRLIIIAVIIAVFIPSVHGNLSSTAEFVTRTRKPLFYLLLPILLFFLLRVSVHSLGDGYQRSFEIEQGAWYFSIEALDFFIHALVYHLINYFVAIPATTAMAAVSMIAGIAFVYILFRMAPFEKATRLLFILSVLGLGGSQFFFGYAESYTLLYLFAVWYLLLAFREGDATAGFAAITAVYLLAGLAHQLGLILLPSYLYLAHIRYAGHPRRLMIFPFVLIAAALPILLPMTIDRIFDAGMIGSLSDYLLPLTDETYGLLSMVHIFDIVNQLLLTAPLLIMLLPFIPQFISNKKRLAPALALIIPALLFLLCVDPKLSMARDWDLFALPVTLITIPFIYSLLDSRQAETSFNKSYLTGSVLTALIILFSWVALNSSQAAHLQRAEQIIDHSVKGQPYGYELLAFYYSTNDDIESELRILQKIEPGWRSARIYGKIAQANYVLGRNEQAYQMAQLGVTLDNPTLLNILIAGVTAADREEYDRAVFYLRIATDMDPTDIDNFCKLGDVLCHADSVDAALRVYFKAMDIDRDYPRPYFCLANAFRLQGDYQKAVEWMDAGMRRFPSYPGARDLWERIQVLNPDSADTNN
ncbi:MAG: tetratricopeptide repeat protein [FCB group bacterium]|nr:tetratricopeptide repeat protein [FCB group bacterium]